MIWRASMYAAEGKYAATEENMTMSREPQPSGLTQDQVQGAMSALRSKTKGPSATELTLLNLIRSYRKSHPSCQLKKLILEDERGVGQQVASLDTRCLNCKEADALLIDVAGKEQ